MSTLNIIPWSDSCEKEGRKWANSPLNSRIFLSKWTNLKGSYSIEVIGMAFHEIWDIDIDQTLNPPTFFLRIVLIHLHLLQVIKQVEDVRKLYCQIIQRTGDAIHGHENIWEATNSNISLIVLAGTIVEEHHEYLEIFRKCTQNDHIIQSVLNGELVVPKKLAYPEIDTLGPSNDTFIFLRQMVS